MRRSRLFDRVARGLRRHWFAVAIVALGALSTWRFIVLPGIGIRALQPVPIFAAVAVIPIGLLGLGMRFRRVLTAAGLHLDRAEAVWIATAAYFLNASTPGGLGEVGRIALLRRRYGLPSGIGLAVVVYERGVSIAVTLTMTLAAFLWAHGRGSDGGVRQALVATTAVIALAFVVMSVGPVRRWAETLALRFTRRVGARMVEGTRGFSEALDQLLRRPRVAASFVVWTTIVVGVYGLQLWLVLQASGVQGVDVIAAIALFGAATMAGIVSAIPFGIGSADAVLVLALVQLGVDPGVAAGAAILLRLVNSGPLVVAGFVAAGHLHITSPVDGAQTVMDPAGTGDRDVDG